VKFLDRALLRHIDMLRGQVRELRAAVRYRDNDIERLHMMIDRMDAGLPKELPIGWVRDLEEVRAAQALRDSRCQHRSALWDQATVTFDGLQAKEFTVEVARSDEQCSQEEVASLLAPTVHHAIGEAAAYTALVDYQLSAARWLKWAGYCDFGDAHGGFVWFRWTDKGREALARWGIEAQP
jgi:hypothetical protein